MVIVHRNHGVAYCGDAIVSGRSGDEGAVDTDVRRDSTDDKPVNSLAAQGEIQVSAVERMSGIRRRITRPGR